jgi:DNA-binding NtrC family response regulator
VLLVDDEEPVRRAFGRRLTTAGATVVTAGDVAAAVQILSEAEFDVVVTDLAMPGAPDSTWSAPCARRTSTWRA